jgi:hypothetical protein
VGLPNQILTFIFFKTQNFIENLGKNFKTPLLLDFMKFLKFQLFSNSELFNLDQSNLYHIKILQTHIYYILKGVNIKLVKSKLLLSLPHD